MINCLCVRDDVAFGPANLGLDAVEIARASSKPLMTSAPPGWQSRHRLSGGERRRAAVASVLSMSRRFSCSTSRHRGRPLGRHELAELLTSLPQTQLVVTHDLPFALATCARSLVLDQGKIALDLETKTLLNDRISSHATASRCRSAIAPDGRYPVVPMRATHPTVWRTCRAYDHLRPSASTPVERTTCKVRRCRCRRFLPSGCGATVAVAGLERWWPNST